MSSLSIKPSQKNTLRIKIKAKLLACFGDTTAHGYGRVASADSRPLRWFWILVCAAAVAAFSQQLYGITKQYMSRPLKVRVSIGHEEKLTFPQVTVCNLNMIRRSHIPVDIVTEFPQILDGRSIKRNSSKAANNASFDSSEGQTVVHFSELSEEETIIQSVLQKLADRPEEKLMKYGHQIEDMILNCKFHRRECLDRHADMRKYWTQFWHTRYGNCYSFNKGVDKNGTYTPLMTSAQTGLGLTLEINIEQDEYISQLSQEAGVRVFLGGQEEMPFPREQGISVAPGYSTAIQLRKVIIKRLDPFRNSSCESRNDRFQESIFGRYNVTYSTTACKISCLVQAMKSNCGCVIYELKYSNIPVCNVENTDIVKCVNKVYKSFDDGNCSRCQERCRETIFKTTVSLAKWPSKQYRDTLITKINEENHHNHSGETSDHFLKLKIYYGQLDFEVIEEEEAYSIPSFLSDIGGLMGMWIGISVLTIVELLELIITLCITVFKMYLKRADRVRNIKLMNNSGKVP
ncbi:acid-sensing ion channel 1C-like [Stylophora pistillata]|uniref:acid-sensing ion channel 1C-like n=1 Tax=Stylophora pistillata TaxID=50429 RepID=UPI000C039CCF|nr:acid-sensing ion channel 1C-like [Stylophora pistillata]